MARLLSLFFLIVPVMLRAQHVPIIKLADLRGMVANDTLYVVNFWATWCGPCVKELPHFEAVGAQLAHQKVKVILISLDYADKLNDKVIPFLKDRAIKSQVALLDERDPNIWIPAIDSTWTGSIPATALYRNGQKLAFAEREFDHNALLKFVEGGWKFER